MRTISNAVSTKGNFLKNFGAVLTGADATAYDTFVAGLMSSKVVSDESGSLGLSTDASKLQDIALAAVTSMMIDFMNSVTVIPNVGEIKPALEKLISENADGDEVETYKFTHTSTLQNPTILSTCATDTGSANSCKAAVNLDVEIMGIGGGNQRPTYNILTIQNFKFTIKTFKVWNATTRLEFDAGQAISFDKLVANVYSKMVDGVATSEFEKIEVTQFKNLAANLVMNAKDSSSGHYTKSAWGAKATNVVTNLVLGEEINLGVKKLDTTTLNITTEYGNSAGDKVSSVMAATPRVVGADAINVKYAASDFEFLNEDDTKYIGLAMTTNYAAKVGNKTLITADEIVGRTSPKALSLDGFTLKHSGITYSMTGTTDFKTSELESLACIDPKSSTKISFWTREGATGGTVTDSTGKVLGNAKKVGDDWVITYTDGTSQML